MLSETQPQPVDSNPPRPRSASQLHDEVQAQTTMRVKKRNGSSEPVDVNKIVRAVAPLLRRASPTSTR